MKRGSVSKESINIKNDLITYNTLLFSDKIEKMLKYTDRTDKIFKNTFQRAIQYIIQV